MIKALALLCGSVALVSACTFIGGDESSSPPQAAPVASETSTSQLADDDVTARFTARFMARFEEGPCRFEAPAGSDPRCGTVAVPMNWDSGEGTIELAVAVFSSTAERPAPDPVVYLEGGPGGHSLETIRFVDNDLLEPLRERGDVVFFDQRGAGLSTPRLHCPDLTALERELEDNPGLDEAEIEDRFHLALSSCRDQLTSEGIELGDFDSINNAHDVEAIRVALGYEQWNLLGVSYGTKLGLETMRQHPDGIRAVILDSVFPPQVDSVLENPSTFLASLEAVVEACRNEPLCAEGGDLGARLKAVAQRYDSQPVQVEVEDYLSGEVDDVYVEGETIVRLVTQALYSPYWFTDLPELVSELEAGELSAVGRFLSQQRTNEPFFSAGMFYAIECNEEVAFSDPQEVVAALPADPFGLRDRFEYASNNGSNAFDTCDAFGSTPAPASSNEPVISDIPTLVLAGRFDPVTPVSWAEAAASTLANSYLIVAPNASHGLSSGTCGMSVVRRFLDETGSEPDSSCYEEERLVFLATDREPPDLEPFSYDTGLGAVVSGVRPADWERGELAGDFYRQDSLLDATLLFQLVGDRFLVGSIEAYVSEVFDVPLGSPVDGPVADRTWTRRGGRTSGAAVEYYETVIDGFVVIVLLVSSPAEHDQNIETVLLPALQSIELEPLS